MNPPLYDSRDSHEHDDVAALLDQRPAVQPAREAYGRGAGTIKLTHLVADHTELVDGLKKAFLPGWGRHARAVERI